MYGLEFDAPGGKKSMHPTNQHTLKPVYVGEILKNGQFKIVYSSDGLVSPDSYSPTFGLMVISPNQPVDLMVTVPSNI